VPFYIDSILPVEGIASTVVSLNEYIISIYPNPFVSHISVDFTNNSGKAGNFKVKLYDFYASLQLQAEEQLIDDNESKTFILDTSELNNGFYYLQFLDYNNAVVGYRIINKNQ